jgi:hypothetical protein
MTNFKEYLRSQKQNDYAAHNDAESAAKMAAEWSLLKEKVRALSANEAYKGEAFEWAPYEAAYTDFVKLKNVAAIFRESRSLPDIPLSCEVLFSRRPLAANQVWSVEKAPPAQLWHLAWHAQEGEAKWQVKELRKNLTAEDLANEILIALVKYFNEYEDFYQTGQWLR